jgi:predicted RNA binding protein YcfA (HicA-like mRNA interferase family)
MPNDLARKIRDLVQYLCQHGWSSTTAKNGHWKLTSPEGQKIQLPFTPSGTRALKNARARLRRAGAELPPR